MSLIRKNIAANYAGSFWTAVMSVIFIPLYIKFMGIESFALVGVFVSMRAAFNIFDIGLSASMTREMARLSAVDPTGHERRDLARTLEIIYWIVALLLGLIVVVLAGPIADYWVKPEHLDPSVVKQAIMITGAVVALQWPVSFYSGGLRGLDCQVTLNVITCAGSTLRGLGSVAVLWLISPTIQAYFLFQIAASAVHTFCLAGAFWLSLPGRNTPAGFSLAHLKRIWRFSAGMTGISVTGMLLTQTDKIILSRMLPLKLFGYYTLAWTVSATLLRIIDPVDAGVYPTLTRLAAQRNERELSDMYHKSTQMEVVLLVPAALALIFFGQSILSVWSGNAELAQRTALILSILAIGTCLNGLVHIPYLTQLAYGWTSLAFYQQIVSVIVLIPLMVMLTHAYQGTGAAYVWVIFNAGYLLAAIQVMHKRILPGAKREWYVYDVGIPTAGALVVAFAGWMIMPPHLGTLSLVLYLGVVSGLCLVAAVCAAPMARVSFLKAGKSLFSRLVLRGKWPPPPCTTAGPMQVKHVSKDYPQS